MRVDLLRAHGSLRRYKHGKCRCSLCRAANNRNQTAWVEDRRDSINARNRERYWSGDRERILASNTEWRAAHAEQVRAGRKRWALANPERNSALQREWRAENHERVMSNVRARKARVRNAEGRHTGDDVKAQYERQCGRCYWCGWKVGDEYHVDHVVPLVLGGGNGPENIVVSCASCNLHKRASHPMDWAGQLF